MIHSSDSSGHSDQVRDVFARRAEFYVTSSMHTDPLVLSRLIEAAKPQRHQRALDIATGAGHTAFALAPHVAEVVAVDLTAEMLDQARQLQQTNSLRNVMFEIADAHALPYPDASFDIVASRRAPHHFRDIALALREMRRVLRPGGRLVIDDRSAPEDDAADEILHQLDVWHDPSHVRQYRPSVWQRMLEQAGFRIESLDIYTRLRPISHMKSDNGPGVCRQIDTLMAGLTEAQKKILGVETKDGELHHLHFFVMIAAVK